MMLGKAESASFAEYRLNIPAGGEESGAGNVSEALRGKTIGERNREALDAAGGNPAGTEAYQVDIGTRERNWMTYVSGSTARISSSSSVGAGWTREEELAALEQGIRDVQKMNENYRLTGNPIDPREEQERMAAVVAQFSSEALDRLQTAEKNGISPVKQDFAQVLKTSTGLENSPAPVYTPVTEIRTRHYRWTEKAGIEEIVTREQEIAAHKEVLRKEIADAVGRSIGEILKPYESYEEAYDALYGDENGGAAFWAEVNEDTMTIDMRLKNVHGAFGAFANYLNDYLEQFGAEDSFFNDLASALEELSGRGDNDLVAQMRRMVETVRSGEHIETESEEFRQEVEDAISGVYGSTAGRKSEETQKKAKHELERGQGLTFLDLQRRAAEEEGRLLDELLGREHDDGFESPGDVLAKRAPEGRDAEFTDRLRHLDERREPAQPFTFATENAEERTERPEGEIAQQQAVYDAWTEIGERLAGSMQRKYDESVTEWKKIFE